MAYALKTEESASRRVIVKDLSPVTKQEDIIIHFQRRGNGGGEVDSVHMLNERTAIVTFEKSEVAESVLKRQHKIDDSLVTLELYRPFPDQVFGRVSGRIDPSTLNESSHSMRTILQRIQNETEIEWREIFDGFVVSGTFDQIKAVNELLKTKLKETKHGRDKSSPSLPQKVTPASESPMTPSSGKFRKKRNQRYREASTTPNQEDTHSTSNKLNPAIDDSVLGSQYSLNPDKFLQFVLEKDYSKDPPICREVNGDASDKCNKPKVFPTSDTEKMVIRDASPLSFAAFSDVNVGMNNATTKTQHQEKTKQLCEAKTLRETGEQNKGKVDDLTSQLDYETGERNKSDANDLRHKVDEFHVIKTEKDHTKDPETCKKVKSDASDKCNKLKDIPTSKTDPMVIRDGSPLSFAVLSDVNVGMNNTATKTQHQEETKQHFNVTTFGATSEQNKGKMDDLISQLDYKIEEESKSDARDLQPKPEEFHDIKTEGGSVSTLPVGTEENADKAKAMECYTTSNVVSNGNQKRHTTGQGCHMFDTITGLRVLLVKGDITSQKVDVLISPIDPSLLFENDFLKRILDKGGQAIKHEYLGIQETHAPPTNLVITGGGNLPCRALLFVVLPPWNNETQDKKKCKQQIHRCLKEAIILSSGYRHQSIAVPLLGQNGNDIPVEVSAEVIVRVIAAFGKNIGPMHSGINEFRIVCEDEASLAVVVDEISSLSFLSGKPFFVSRSSNSKLVHAEETDVPSASQNFTRNEAEIDDLSLEKVSSVNQDQEEPSRTESSKKHTFDQVGELQVVSQVSASKSSKLSVEKETVPSTNPSSITSPSCQVDSTSRQNHVDWDSNNKAEQDRTLGDKKQVNEKRTCHVSRSSGKYARSNVLSNGNQDLSITEQACYKFDTVTGLGVVLVKGNITSQQVDVLISPIDPLLSFKSDFLKRILEKGGQSIKHEYLGLKETNAPSQGPVIMDGGNLPCRAILFAVLPRWSDEMQDKKKCKQQIHRCLKEAIILSSGYRHQSIALPLFGQDGNDIPVEVSAEVIVRVIAAFGKNIGPIHSGINKFRIVCNDEASLAVVVNEISSFSFRSGEPFFVIRWSNSELVNAEETDDPSASQSLTRNEDKIDYQSQEKVRSVDKVHEAPSKTKSSRKQNSVDHVISQNSTSKSSELTVEKVTVPSGYSSFISPSFQVDSTSDQNHVDCYTENEAKEDETPNDEKQINEKTICHVSSSSVHCIEMNVTRASEILQGTSVTQRVEEKIKSMTVLNQPHSDFVTDHTLNLKQEKIRTGTREIEEKTVGTVTQEAVYVNRGPQLQKFLRGKKQGGGTQDQNRDKDSSNSSKDHISLPTWHDEPLKDPSSMSKSFTKFKDSRSEATGVSTIQALDKSSKEESSGSFRTQTETAKTSMAFFNRDNKSGDGNKTDKGEHSKKEITAYPPSRSIPGIAEKELKKNEVLAHKDEYVKRKKDDQNLNDEILESKLNERQVYILCALCHDTVDHPDLTDPKICTQHKFCDDCIIKAFTFSSMCPACLDTVGLITTNKLKVGQNKDIHSSSKNPSYQRNKIVDYCLTSTPDVIQANQPPGEMLWKKYQTSLPGFEGCDTIAVTFAFYDGVQGLEHPNPGVAYKGTRRVAYVPDTQEGKEVMKLLRKGFDARLLFAISSSAPDGVGDVSLNDIELKTSLEKHSRNGYPDDGYLTRVRHQLAAKGIC